MEIKKLWIPLVVILSIFGSYKAINYYLNHRESALIDRAALYWNAVAANDILTIFQLQAESAHGNLTPDEVKLGRDWSTRLIHFDLAEVTTHGNSAEIQVKREITLPDTTTGKTMVYPPFKDHWTFIKGEWYHGTPEKGGSGMKRR